MIEAIPVSTECLILVITKVEDPDELDTRFSKFSSFNIHDNIEKTDLDEDEDDLMNCFGHIDDYDEADEGPKPIVAQADSTDKNSKNKTEVNVNPNLIKVYSFRSLNEVTKLANVLLGYYHGSNTLYKNTANSTYYLVLNKSNHSAEEFNKICNMVSEFGKSERSTYASPAYYEEHYEVIVKDFALQILSVM